MPEINSQPEPKEYSDPFLLREAGDGWHENGVNRTLMHALVGREFAGVDLATISNDKSFVNLSEEEQVKALEMARKSYDSYVQRIDKLKEELDIGEPPEASLEEAESWLTQAPPQLKV